MNRRTESCVVLGAGGHARMVLACLELSGAARPVAIVDPDPARRGTRLDGIEVVGGDERLAELRAGGVGAFAVGVGSTGARGERPGDLRRTLFERALEAGLEPVAVVHPTAIWLPRAKAGAGVQLMPGAVVNVGARLGDGALLNTRAVVEHDAVIGAHAHLASGAIVAGGARVGAGALIGAGAVVIQGVEVGAGAVIGAGSVVLADVAPGARVAGAPARPIRGGGSA